MYRLGGLAHFRIALNYEWGRQAGWQQKVGERERERRVTWGSFLEQRQRRQRADGRQKSCGDARFSFFLLSASSSCPRPLPPPANLLPLASCGLWWDFNLIRYRFDFNLPTVVVAVAAAAAATRVKVRYFVNLNGIENGKVIACGCCKTRGQANTRKQLPQQQREMWLKTAKKYVSTVCNNTLTAQCS